MMPGLTSGWARLEDEIAGEKLSALRRIAETLESLITEAERLRARLPQLAGTDLEVAAAAHASAREQARRYRWYLQVQREALGILRHDILDELYPLPPIWSASSPATQ